MFNDVGTAEVVALLANTNCGCMEQCGGTAQDKVTETSEFLRNERGTQLSLC